LDRVAAGGAPGGRGQAPASHVSRGAPGRCTWVVVRGHPRRGSALFPSRANRRTPLDSSCSSRLNSRPARLELRASLLPPMKLRCRSCGGVVGLVDLRVERGGLVARCPACGAEQRQELPARPVTVPSPKSAAKEAAQKKESGKKKKGAARPPPEPVDDEDENDEGPTIILLTTTPDVLPPAVAPPKKATNAPAS